ncbi:MAG: N-methyl-D-aspartate receptor NMDAR2C subunit [Nanoarchaeota archaeon]
MNLQTQWKTLCQKMQTTGDVELAYWRLHLYYTEPHRAYHTLEHIAEGLQDLKDAIHYAEHPTAVEMAWWHHDAVYQIGKKDNEENSALLAAIQCLKLGLPNAFAQRTGELVLATQHLEPPKDIDAQLLVDTDLSILGKPDEVFDRYEHSIWTEYVQNDGVPETFFKTRRAEILEQFLRHPTIYTTEFYRAKYEGKARENLERSIRQLRR